MTIEHPSSVTECIVECDDTGQVGAAGMLRTARKPVDGFIFAGSMAKMKSD